MQNAFIDALVHPVFKLLAEVLPLVDDYCIKSLQSNRAFWNSMQNQDILTTTKILAYLKGIRDHTKENSSAEESEKAFSDDFTDEAIPGIPANAVKAQFQSTRKLSLISMKEKITDPDDPEIGEVTLVMEEENSLSNGERKIFQSDKIRRVLRNFLEHNASQMLLLIATIYALFANDMNLAIGTKDADIIVDSISIFVLIVFVLEIILSIFCVSKYIQFFLWLDVAASVSLLLEIDLLIGSGDSPGELSLAKASRAAKAGARAGR